MGERHIFIRFEECHIHCEYCDELDKPAKLMSLEEIIQTTAQLEKEEGPHSFVSLTGGEPLLYVNFLEPLMLRLKAQGFRIYLETNGILCQALEQVLGWCDVIAMDMKPASVTKEKSFLAEHRRFLQLAKNKEVFIKIIISKEINVTEFQEHICLIQEMAPETPVILQPVSRGAVTAPTGTGRGTSSSAAKPRNPAPTEGHEDPALMELLGELQRMAGRMIPDVRIMPRLHRILRIR